MTGKGGREGKAHTVGAKGSEGPWWMVGKDRHVDQPKSLECKRSLKFMLRTRRDLPV